MSSRRNRLRKQVTEEKQRGPWSLGKRRVKVRCLVESRGSQERLRSAPKRESAVSSVLKAFKGQDFRGGSQ